MMTYEVVFTPDVDDLPSEPIHVDRSQYKPVPVAECKPVLADKLADEILDNPLSGLAKDKDLPRAKEVAEFSDKPWKSRDGKRTGPSRKARALEDLRSEFRDRLEGIEMPMRVDRVGGRWSKADVGVFEVYPMNYTPDQEKARNYIKVLAVEMGYTAKPKAPKAVPVEWHVPTEDGGWVKRSGHQKRYTKPGYWLDRGFAALMRAVFPYADSKKPHVEVCGSLKVPVATVNAWAPRSKPKANRYLWDLRRFETLRDALEYDEMQMLRSEHAARRAELPRLAECVADAKRALWLWSYLRTPHEDGKCLGRTSKGHRCGNSVKGTHCHLHRDQRPESPPFVVAADIVLRAAVDMAWELWLQHTTQIEAITRRGRFLKAVLNRMLQEKAEPLDPTGEYRPEYFTEDDQTRRARWLWAEGRAVDLTIEGHRDRDGLAAAGDDAPDEWRDWDASMSYRS